MALSPIFAASVALVPGIHAWWTGRALSARTDDPAFPELLLARTQSRLTVFFAAGTVVVMLASAHWLWTIPLMLLGAIAGGFFFRRALFSEAWGLPDYIRYTIFSVVGGGGFWILLAFAPRIIVAVVEGWSPAQPVMIAAVLATLCAIGLIVWEANFPRVWLALHRASPLQRPDLQPRLDDIVRRAGVIPPGVFRYGARGGYVMNAIALPSARHPGVAFGDTMLELLDADEITAVFAHEVAHLEHYDARRIARFGLITKALLLSGVAIAILPLALLPARAGLITTIWPVVAIAVLLHRVSKSKAHEAESDRRSAELVGDPEPMVRALTKLHHYSRLPRRWPYDFERSATHPSLARRIQSLRGAPQSIAPGAEVDAAASLSEAAAPVTVIEPTVARSTKTGVWIALDATRIYWFEGVPDGLVSEAASPSSGTPESSTGRPGAGPVTLALLRERATSYRATACSDLAELRVAVSRRGRSITARDRAGVVTVTPLHADDVAAVQRALDLLDGQLATSVRHNWRGTARKVAAVALLVIIASMDLSWQWIPLLIVLAAPSAWSLAALGTAMVAQALFSALASGQGEGRWSIVMILAVLVGGAACWKAWQWVTIADPARRRKMAHAVLASACALLIAGVTTYRTRAASLHWTPAQADVIARVAATGAGHRVELSPDGRHVAIQSVDPVQLSMPYDDADESGTAHWQFTIADASGASSRAPRTISALGLTFLDDRRVLVLRTLASSEDSLEILTQGVDADSGTGWRRVLPALMAPRLAVDRAAARWTVTGYDQDAGDAVMVSGGMQSDSLTITRDSHAAIGGSPLQVSSDGTRLLATPNMFGGTGRMMLTGIGLIPYSWAISRGGHGDRERIGSVPGNPECAAHGEPTAVLCVVTGQRGASLWRIDDREALTSLGMLPRRFDLWRATASNQLIGADRIGGALVVVDVNAGRARRVELGKAGGGDDGYIVDMAAAGDVVAALRTMPVRSEVTLYRVR